MAELLIRNGANISAETINEFTALHSAAKNGNFDVNVIEKNSTELNRCTMRTSTVFCHNYMSARKAQLEVYQFYISAYSKK